MAREKMPEFKRKGNWKNAPGSQAATKKNAPVGMGAKPKAKPAKPKIGAGAKPKPKPAIPSKSATSGASRSTAGKVQQSTRSMSQKERKPLKTGARSSRTSGTGYKEGSFMDRMTRAVRRNVYGKK